MILTRPLVTMVAVQTQPCCSATMIHSTLTCAVVHVQLKEKEGPWERGGSWQPTKGWYHLQHEMAPAAPRLMTAISVYHVHTYWGELGTRSHSMVSMMTNTPRFSRGYNSIINTNCFIVEDLFIAPTTRQQPAEAASTKGPLHYRPSSGSGSPERMKLWPREGFIVRLVRHCTARLPTFLFSTRW